MNELSASEALSVETLVAQVADEFLERVQRGERPDIEEYARRYPQVATLLRQMLPTLQLLPDLDPASLSGDTGTTAAASGCLGDYRIVKEVGRGGMGVVYEAEQISLGRRVALKVLPFAAALDVRQLQRFKNEAQAAGQLQHAHIVPVHAVGQERGVHYYAMQFIEGQSLAAFIRELRLGCGLGAERLDEHPTMSLRKFKKASGAAHDVISAKAPASAGDLPAASAAGTVPAAALTTERSIFRAEYFRTAAELGRQAAEALEHAHQMGVIHRDVKPANLLMDLDGKLWVTDFGLAHCQSQAVLTMTGDLLGTLRYMSPEQALARRVGVDHRTDIYSLGVTLYELVTLQPAFSGRDRAALLQQIAFAEPRPPRQLNRTVPAELQTILLKAMEKSPDERYATAQELADDLGRWLTDEPIRARRPSLWRRLRKWSRRHRAAALGLTAVVLTSLASAGGMAWSFQRERAVRQRETERGVTAALAQAETLLEEGEKQIDFPEHWRTTVRLAQSAVERAEELLRSGQATSELAKRVHPLRAQVDQVDGDSRLALELDRIRLKQSGVKGNFFDTARAAPLYAKALADYGINPAAPESAAARIGSSRLRPTLLVALENWRRCSPDEAQKRRLAAVLQATEPARGAFRTRWMAALTHADRKTLVKLAGEQSVESLSPAAVISLANDLSEMKEHAAAEQLLRGGLERFPGDFWLHHQLAEVLLDKEPSQPAEAARHLTAAIALRSDSPGAYYNLGVALKMQGDWQGAIREYQAALRLDPNYTEAHNNLGVALSRQGDRAGGIREFKAAIQCNPKHKEAYYNLGVTLIAQGDHEGAIRQYQAAIQIDPKYAGAHYNLGKALIAKGDREGAVREYQAAVDIDGNYAEAHCNLGIALRDEGHFAEAVRHLKVGHELGSRRAGWQNPSAAWLAEAQGLLELDAKLTKVLRGEASAKDNAEKLRLAGICQLPNRQMNAAAVRLYADAFAAEPKLAEDLRLGNRYNAACAAALAGCGRGKDSAGLPARECARLRRQALFWLQADLTAWRKMLEQKPDNAGPSVLKQMMHWQQDTDLAGVRENALANLPEEERQTWQELWQNVLALRMRAARPTKDKSSSPVIFISFSPSQPAVSCR